MFRVTLNPSAMTFNTERTVEALTEQQELLNEIQLKGNLHIGDAKHEQRAVLYSLMVLRGEYENENQKSLWIKGFYSSMDNIKYPSSGLNNAARIIDSISSEMLFG